MDGQVILIVEDDPNVRQILRITVKSLAAEVLVAEDGVEGLRMFRDRSPILVLLDLRMPKMDGFEFLAQIKPRLDDAYAVIVLTGSDDSEDIRRSYELGAHMFLPKPFNVTLVREVVKQTLNLKHLEGKRRSMEDKIRRLNEELELKVQERTSSLEATIIRHQEVEGRVRQSESYLKAIFNNSLQCFLLIDEKSVVKVLNKITMDRAISIYGKGIKEGDSVFKLFNEQTFPEFKELFAQALGGGNPLVEKKVAVDPAYYLWLEFNFSPVIEESLPGKYVFLTINDITIRKEAEESLRRVNEDLERKVDERTQSLRQEIAERRRKEKELLRILAAVEGATDALLIVDNNGEAVYVNRTFTVLLGYDLEATRVRPIDELLGGEPGGGDGHLDDGEGKWHAEVSIASADGERLPVMVKASPILDEGGESLGSFYVITDLRGQKQAESKRSEMEHQLRQSQKLESIGQLASGIAHEINTPTQFVGDNTEFLRASFSDLLGLLEQYRLFVAAAESGGDTGELAAAIAETAGNIDLDFLLAEIPEAIEQSLGGIKRIAEIVKAMKDFSHPAAEQKRMIDINQAINTTITVTRNEWKYVAELRTELDPELPPVPCFPGEFNQVILNIIVNAAHAIAEKPRTDGAQGNITLTTSRQDGQAVVAITDDGAGIPEEARPRIFDPFFTTKDIGKGTGQGLAIAYNIIVKKHGGAIDFTSELGKGTTFLIRLPLEYKDSDSAAESGR